MLSIFRRYGGLPARAFGESIGPRADGTVSDAGVPRVTRLRLAQVGRRRARRPTARRSPMSRLKGLELSCGPPDDEGALRSRRRRRDSFDDAAKAAQGPLAHGADRRAGRGPCRGVRQRGCERLARPSRGGLRRPRPRFATPGGAGLGEAGLGCGAAPRGGRPRRRGLLLLRHLTAPRRRRRHPVLVRGPPSADRWAGDRRGRGPAVPARRREVRWGGAQFRRAGPRPLPPTGGRGCAQVPRGGPRAVAGGARPAGGGLSVGGPPLPSAVPLPSVGRPSSRRGAGLAQERLESSLQRCSRPGARAGGAAGSGAVRFMTSASMASGIHGVRCRGPRPRPRERPSDGPGSPSPGGPRGRGPPRQYICYSNQCSLHKEQDTRPRWREGGRPRECPVAVPGAFLRVGRSPRGGRIVHALSALEVDHCFQQSVARLLGCGRIRLQLCWSRAPSAWSSVYIIAPSPL